ncbi:MAG TPA: sugar ABC transporter substrate-binding protein [Bacteroidota bacterium]|nr:sugar ABC transporter substrate-binding protein [Bacteroidota bacterium]
MSLVLYHWMEKDRPLWEEEIIRPFEESHPGIHVVLQTSPYALYVSRSLTSIASGTRLADLMFAEDWFGQELIRTGYTRDIMPYVRRDISLNDFYSEALTEWRGSPPRGEGREDHEGLYGFPACLGLTVLFYNKDIFDRAGIPYPDTTWTYDDLVRTGRKLTVDTDGDGIPDQWGLSFDVHYTGLETVIYSQGGRMLTPDGRHAVLEEPATLKSLEFIRDIFLKDRIASNTTSFVNAWDLFAGQRAAMILIGSLGAASLEGSSIRWDMTFPPRGASGLRRSRRFSMAFMIPQNSPHPDEAWQLLLWILTKSPVEHLNRQYLGMMPTYRAFTASPLWLNASPVHNRNLLVVLEQGESFPLFTPAWQEWRDNNLTPELMLMTRGAKSPAECARDGDRRINAVLDRVNAH